MSTISAPIPNGGYETPYVAPGAVTNAPPCPELDAIGAFESVPGPRAKRETADSADIVPAAQRGRVRHRTASWHTAAPAFEASRDQARIECEDPEDTSTGPATMAEKSAAIMKAA